MRSVRQRNPIMVTGMHLWLVQKAITLNVIFLAIREFPNPLQFRKALRRLRQFKESFFNEGIRKMSRVDGKYYWIMGGMSWPSSSFNHQMLRELKAFINPEKPILRNVFFAITKKCPLNCVHCFEGDILNRPGDLSTDEIIHILRQLENYGTMQVQFSGGEPMIRYKDILKILGSKNKSTEYWIITSGHGLTANKARKLKSLGLDGVCVSIDHYNPELHNAFRRNSKSFDYAMDAARNARMAGLPLCLNICVRSEIVNFEDLLEYATLARELDASFIQLLEPRQVGNWKDTYVQLNTEEMEILESFTRRLNSESQYSTYPIVTYPGEHQRRIGCFGAGKRFFYIDTNGDAHACPFCNQKCGSLLTDDLGMILSGMSPCQAFPGVKISEMGSTLADPPLTSEALIEKEIV